MCIEVLFRHLQGEFQAFLFGKGSKTHMSLFQYLRYIAFRKIQTESLTFRFTEVKQLVSQVQQPFRILLHYIQVFPRFRIDLFLQYNVFQWTFNQRQRCTYLSKELMKKYHIPTAQYETFTDMEQALAYIHRQGAPIVVKADGLALGKGVVVASTVEEAEEAVRSMMQDHKFGKSGSTVVIEECMVGPEVTVLAFCDGEHLVPMLSSQDHKRAYDGNQGPNTGGMGAFCPSPNYTPAIAAECMEKIFLPTVKAMQAEGRPFQGVLYFGLMLTQDGPKVVEYNARFGDPETQPILSMLDTDLMDIFQACVNGTLDQVDIRWKEGAACCIVLASGGYPVQYQSGYPISGLEEAGKLATVFHAGTKGDGNGRILTAGGRVLGVTAVGGSLEEAIETAYAACKPIAFQDMHFRTDIGKV